jgi:hypothetical protein
MDRRARRRRSDNGKLEAIYAAEALWPAFPQARRCSGATTLRVYAAWRSEADQRAAATLSGRMPSLPEGAVLELDPSATAEPRTTKKAPIGPYHRIADDLRGAIAAGILHLVIQSHP